MSRPPQSAKGRNDAGEEHIGDRGDGQHAIKNEASDERHQRPRIEPAAVRARGIFGLVASPLHGRDHDAADRRGFGGGGGPLTPENIMLASTLTAARPPT